MFESSPSEKPAGMFARALAPAGKWFSRHPCVRDALLWALPALLIGAMLRGLVLSYLPYAYWGSDSNSYFSFAEKLLQEGKVSLYDKRRFTYPIFMLPVTMLPGATLKWVAWIQHAIGLATLVALAYSVRKIFRFWRWWVVPVTVLYAIHPMILWYEHEVLAENLFFAAVVWTVAGWQAWAGSAGLLLRSRRWWCFFIPFAFLVLTKPAGRFLWPGVLFAIWVSLGWRWIRWREAIALLLTAILTLMIGRETQAAWLLYTSAFPLTQLETPKHGELKAEIRNFVREAREGLQRGEVTEDKDWKQFLKNPGRGEGRPLWKELARDERRMAEVYRDLAKEGIRAEPWLYVVIAAQKILLSANPDEFNDSRFEQNYSVVKFEHLYERFTTESPWRLRALFGLGKDEPLPPYSVVKTWIAPAGHEKTEAWMSAYVGFFEDCMELVDQPDEKDGPLRMDHFEATNLSIWILAAALISCTPWFFRRLGVWVGVSALYLIGVFLVGGANPRFFGPVWSVLVLLLPVPLDALAEAVRRLRASPGAPHLER